MRILFWILLLANVILFAIMQRGGLRWGEQAYQPQPALHEERIRLLDAPQSAPVSQSLLVKATPNSASLAVPVITPAQVAASAPVANHAPVASPALAGSTPAVVHAPVAKQASVAVKQNDLICLEWGDFSGTDLKRATEVLSAMQLGDKLGQRQIQYDKGYWVYIPPLKNRAAANKKVAQIKSLGITEYFIVQDAGSLRHAISLGVFKTHDTAQNYLNELHAKGLRAAVIGERASKLRTTMFMLNRVDAMTESKLAEAKKDFPGSELKNVPCTLTK